MIRHPLMRLWALLTRRRTVAIIDAQGRAYHSIATELFQGCAIADLRWPGSADPVLLHHDFTAEHIGGEGGTPEFALAGWRWSRS